MSSPTNILKVSPISLALLLLASIPTLVLGQTRQRPQGTYWSVTGSYFDIKDEMNHGFVFRGPDAVVELGVRRVSRSRYLDYSISFGGGGKKGVDSWGFRWLLVPFRGAYLFNVYRSDGGTAVFFGPSLWFSYDIQNYPDLHAGFVNWMTDHGIGIQTVGFLDFRGQSAFFRAELGLLSLTSRPDPARDPHQFRLGVGEILSDIHSGFDLDTPLDHTRSYLELGLVFDHPATLGYTVRYLGHYPAAKFEQLSHELKYSRFLGGRK